MDTSSIIQTKALSKSKDKEEYDLYKSALEWDLIDPIIIKDRSDIKSEYKWKDHVEPYQHQVSNLITFCRRLPVTLLADDVGLGKTISAGLIISELISRNRVSKILIVCPKILMPQWREELDLKFKITAIEAIGKKLTELNFPDDSSVAVITTYQSARIYFDILSTLGFEMLILDEAHKLRNLYGVEKTPQVAKRFHQALSDRVFKYVLMLTATPIHNRLWDLYSLIDLLTVARGHENPLGSEGLFARNFIADNRSDARHLKPEKAEEFRSIVYGYMSRVRRIDAKLDFPERIVQLHRVIPSKEELELINTIAEPIQKLNPLAQISILQALISSPEALSAQLNNMARRQTIPESLAIDVQEVVKRVGVTAKLNGLNILVERLRSEKPDAWRLVIFTGRRETQTSIQIFLEKLGIKCGLINGDSGQRNQDTIARFKKSNPEINVIISTEAGSEGVNLQSANVLINYDLPWNPMIVEQRIGRIQRLASEHKNVSIFNIVLKDTFEEKIVGRLMEKLQMAAHAIGDIESLLEGSGLSENEDEVSDGFEEQIRKLVIASLAGKDIEEATRMTEESISNAKVELEAQQKVINTLLGAMDSSDMGPLCPNLPKQIKSLSAKEVSLLGLESLGGKISQIDIDSYSCNLDGDIKIIQFNEDLKSPDSDLYAPGTSSFESLVGKITSSPLHNVSDVDDGILQKIDEISRKWVNSFNGDFKNYNIKDVYRCFDGKTLIRVRSTVACDSYERLIESDCSSIEHNNKIKNGLDKIPNTIEDPSSIGIIIDKIINNINADEGISEFCRFYNERKSIEIQSAGDDLIKRKRLNDDFTPRLNVNMVGVEGTVHRELKILVNYHIDGGENYTSEITLSPSQNKFLNVPVIEKCTKTNKEVPVDCLESDAITGNKVLRNLLIQSEISSRKATIDNTIICSLTGKRVLIDEIDYSQITGKPVMRSLLKVSQLSGKKAEQSFFGKCEFTGDEVLKDELAISEVSKKTYRKDQQLRSIFSGKTGHKDEFIFCAVTKQPLLPSEGEKCEITNKIVLPGILEQCSITGKKVLTDELEKSVFSGEKALKKFFVSSSLSGARLMEKEAIKSVTGNYCSPLEAKPCAWSGRKCHPEDLKICELTGLQIYFEYLTSGEQIFLEPLTQLLDGINRSTDKSEQWSTILNQLPKEYSNRNSKIESSILSPDDQKLAICLEVRSLLGLRVRQVGLIFQLSNGRVVGHISSGKRTSSEWIED